MWGGERWVCVPKCCYMESPALAASCWKEEGPGRSPFSSLPAPLPSDLFLKPSMALRQTRQLLSLGRTVCARNHAKRRTGKGATWNSGRALWKGNIQWEEQRPLQMRGPRSGAAAHSLHPKAGWAGVGRSGPASGGASPLSSARTTGGVEGRCPGGSRALTSNRKGGTGPSLARGLL